MKCVNDGVIDNTPPDLCQGVIFLEPHDLINNSEQPFDTELFLTILATLLTSFVSSHFIGRVVRWLGKF